MKQYWKIGILALALIFSAQAQSLQRAPERKLTLEVLPQVNITVLVDNKAGSGPVVGEWGLALLIKTDRHQILLWHRPVRRVHRPP